MLRGLALRWKRGSCFVRGCMGVLGMVGTCAACGMLFNLGVWVGLIEEPPVIQTGISSAALTRVAAAYMTATVETWTPTPTLTASATPTITYTPSKTFTPSITPTPKPKATKLHVTKDKQTLYATTSANLRPCPQTTAECAPTGQVEWGEALKSTGKVDGESVGGNALWYQVDYNDRTLYIHSSVVSNTMPVPAAPVVEQPPTSPPVAPAAPAPASSGGVSCGGATTCGQMSSCAQAYACLNAGNRRLDSDHDGVPCEEICGG